MSTRDDGTIRLVQVSDTYWKVTFDIPPLNIFGPANIPQLEKVVSSLESDDRVKVVVFDSAVDGFF
jgi:enoyl-CoA hydratase/carnithine racemase